MNIEFQLLEAGYCLHCERMTKVNGRFKNSQYPSFCALLKHPKHGYILFDTGYSERFNQLTQKFPESLYRRLTPMHLTKSLSEQLAEMAIPAAAINYIIISHFHADHIGGLSDFPYAKFICHQEAYDDIHTKKGWKALLDGFLSELLPEDFAERLLIPDKSIELDEKLYPFTHGFDLFEDKSIIMIALPGHAKGQVGIYFSSTFLVADSCWHSEAFQEMILPSVFTFLIHDNKQEYIQTLQRLHELYKRNNKIDIIPSHCIHARAKIGSSLC